MSVIFQLFFNTNKEQIKLIKNKKRCYKWKTFWLRAPSPMGSIGCLSGIVEFKGHDLKVKEAIAQLMQKILLFDLSQHIFECFVKK